MDNNLLKHYNHPFYAKVDQITDEVKLMQIRKGAEKYPEPFTPSSWTGKELAIHALQELRDGQVYVVGMLERIVELEEEKEEWISVANDRYQDWEDEHMKNKRYKQILEKVQKLTRCDDGTEEEVYNIVTEALGVE
ncbi:hypothetical protein CHI07_16985 [Paenibacillus sp. 7884-2]|nr:hypothetical protein CHI07_16985 [Paenibacillus sp. 7884-2]